MLSEEVIKAAIITARGLSVQPNSTENEISEAVLLNCELQECVGQEEVVHQIAVAFGDEWRKQRDDQKAIAVKVLDLIEDKSKGASDAKLAAIHWMMMDNFGILR